MWRRVLLSIDSLLDAKTVWIDFLETGDDSRHLRAKASLHQWDEVTRGICGDVVAHIALLRSFEHDNRSVREDHEIYSAVEPSREPLTHKKTPVTRTTHVRLMLRNTGVRGLAEKPVEGTSSRYQLFQIPDHFL